MLDGRWSEALSQGYHPGYPALAAAAALLLGNVPFAAHAVSILAGALTPIPAWSIGRRAFGLRGAFFAALLAAVLPEAVDEGSDILVEATYLLFFLSSVALALRAASMPGLPAAAGSGLFAAAAYLVRPEGLAAAAFGPAVVLAGAWLGPALWGRRLAATAVLSAAFLAGFAPYVVFLHGHFGRWMITAKQGGAAFSRAAPQSRMGESQKKVQEKGRSSALYLPGRFLQQLGKTMFLPFAALVVLAAFLRFRVPRPAPAERFARLAILGLVALYLPPLFRLLATMGYVSTRHLLAPAMLLLVFGAGSAAWLSLQWKRGMAVTILAIAAVGLPKSLRPVRTDEIPLKLAGLYLRDVAPGVPFAGPEKAAYYADVLFYHVPQGGSPEIAAALSEAGTPWLVLLEEDQPGVAPTLDGRFELVQSFGGGDARVTVFRFRP